MYVACMYQWNLNYLKLIEKNKLCCADLADAFIQVGKGAGNNATITVALCTSCNGKGLPTARLAIGKYGAIIAIQYTAQTNKHTHTELTTITTSRGREHKEHKAYGNGNDTNNRQCNTLTGWKLDIIRKRQKFFHIQLAKIMANNNYFNFHSYSCHSYFLINRPVVWSIKCWSVPKPQMMSCFVHNPNIWRRK